MSNTNRLFCIRGAVCTENNADSIIQNVEQLFKELLLKNKLSSARDIVSIQFTVTADIDELNPAAALRKGNIGLDTSHIPLFCAQEPVMKKSLPRVIRTLVTVYLPEDSTVQSVYLNGTQVLRPDLAGER